MDNEKHTKKKRPAEASSTAKKMFLNIKSQDGTVVHLQVSRDTRFQKIFKHYCENKNVDYRTVNFLHDGERIPVRRTPNDLQMEDEEEIDCVVFQDGGGCC